MEHIYIFKKEKKSIVILYNYSYYLFTRKSNELTKKRIGMCFIVCFTLKMHGNLKKTAFLWINRTGNFGTMTLSRMLSWTSIQLLPSLKFGINRLIDVISCISTKRNTSSLPWTLFEFRNLEKELEVLFEKEERY